MTRTLITAVLAFALAFFAVAGLANAETTTTTQTTTPGGAPQTGF